MFNIKRYSQISGVDFQNSFLPTINDISWQILLIIMMKMGYLAKIVDIETAFLYGELDEDIYMTRPEGFGYDKDKCALLKKACYGLVQAARQYYKFFIKILKKIGFVGGDADPCLMMRKNKSGVVYIAIWVDNSFLFGNDEAIHATIDNMKREGLSLKI